MSDQDETPRYCWVRVEHRGVSWHLVPEQHQSAPHGYAVATVLVYRSGRRWRQWRGDINYRGRIWWVLTGSTLRARPQMPDSLVS